MVNARVWIGGAQEFSLNHASPAEPAAQADAPNSIAVLCWRGLGAPLSGIPLSGREHTVHAYTPKQGQYLAFIYYFTKIHKKAPSEADIQRYFNVTPPTVHQMILSLERQWFIERTPGQARSIRLLLGREDLPDLE